MSGIDRVAALAVIAGSGGIALGRILLAAERFRAAARTNALLRDGVRMLERDPTPVDSQTEDAR